jgi:hypothetical protein
MVCRELAVVYRVARTQSFSGTYGNHRALSVNDFEHATCLNVLQPILMHMFSELLYSGRWFDVYAYFVNM